MTNLYEGMFLLDNDAVRAGWKAAKATATGLIEKHGGKVHTARRWQECKLAYPIKRKNRATFMLAHYEIAGDGIEGMLRDLELNETVLRYLLLNVDEVPEDERKLSAEEDDDGFSVPEPPADDFVELPPEPEAPAEEAKGEEKAAKADGEEAPKAEAEGEKPAEAAAAPAAEAPATEEKKED